MRILYISDTDHNFGAPKSMLEFIKRTKNDIDFVVLTPTKGQVNEVLNQWQVENHVVGTAIFFTSKFMTTDQASKKLRGDLVYPLLYLRAYFRNRKVIKQVAQVVDLTTFDLVHTTDSLVVLGALLKRRFGIKHVWHLKEGVNEHYSYRYFPKNQIAFRNQYTDAFIAISKFLQSRWQERGLAAEKMWQIYEGRDFPAPLQKNHFKKEWRFCCIGRLSPEKRQMDLLKAVHLLPAELKQQVSIDFWGTGTTNEVNKLIDFVRAHELEQVIHFKGMTNQIFAILPKYKAAITCCAEEGLGWATVECLWAGLDVIAPNAGASVELISEKQNGLLFNAEDASSLADVLQQYLALTKDQSLRQQADYQADVLMQKFKPEESIKAIKALYQAVISKGGGVHD